MVKLRARDRAVRGGYDMVCFQSRARLCLSLVWALGLLLACSAVQAQAVVHHDLRVTLEPDRSHIAVRDRITLPSTIDPERVLFDLYAGLRVRSTDPGVKLTPVAKRGGGLPVRRYRVELPTGQQEFAVEYEGRLNYPLREAGEGEGPFRYTPGMIDEEAVYLTGISRWIPVFGDEMFSLRLEVDLPSGWKAVSQGRAVDGGRVWEETQPQDEIYLIAARFHDYQRQTQWGEAMVYLRQPDEALAERYLDATADYLDLYSRLLGPYPYAKFALVENAWETGYGMPSFTLLGSRVIRLPFILHTSYPHEILHNWWGNGVYLDHEGGNWSEGLTSYLADHLMAERQGRGAGYRRDALQKYADYVAENREFPLAEFRGRHNELTQAVGYSKGLMFFHMLRRSLGDDSFLAGLRRFYRDKRFQAAGYGDVRAAFEAVSGRDLRDMFKQWVERPGAPEFRLGPLEVVATAEGFRIQGVLEQVQDGEAFVLEVPIAVQMEGRAQAVETRVAMETKRLELDLAVSARPLQLAVDPAFDLFRRPNRAEIPPALSQAFAADRMLFVTPAEAPPAMRGGYQGIVNAWRRRWGKVEVVEDNSLNALPEDRAVWLLGWDNRHRERVTAALGGLGVSLDANGLAIDGQAYPRDTHSAVLVARRGGHPLIWTAASHPLALGGLSRKLPHYGKYSYLVFEGKVPNNVRKGQWPVVDSPLQAVLAEGGITGPLALASRAALGAESEADSADNMTPQTHGR